MATKGFWGSGAVDTPPSLSGLTSVGFPTSGDPTRGVPATQPSAAWFYITDQMRVSLVQAAGMTPGASDTQWLEALKSLKWIESGAIDGSKLKTNSITGDRIKNESVTAEKLAKTIDVGASSITLQIKTQTTSERTRLTPAKGELVLDTTTNMLYGGDGTTAGGNLIGGDNKATSALIYDVAEFRKSSTAYVIGDVVACAYQSDKYLECTKAGTTGAADLDTRNATHGQVIADGSVQWTVRTTVRKVTGVLPDENGNVQIDTAPLIASVEEAKAGVDDTKMMTPAKVKTAVQELAPARYTYGTADMTAGESPLETGKLYFVYE